MKKIIAAVLSIIMLFSLSACFPILGSPTGEEKSPGAVSSDVTAPPSDTTSPRPEISEDIKAQDACVLAYFDALRKNDADKIIQISASSETGKNYRRITGSEFMGELFSISSTSDLLKSTWWFIYSILSDATLKHVAYSKETFDKFVQEVNPSQLAGIKVMELGTPLQKPQMPSSMSSNMNVFSFRYCLLSIDEKVYCEVFWLLKSADGYKLALVGEYDNYNISGIAKPCTKDDFESLVDPQTIDEPTGDLPAAGTEQSVEKTYLQKIKDTATPAFKSSKEAAENFVKAIGRSDPYAALSAFDVKEKAAGFDLSKVSEYISVFEPFNTSCMITAYDFYRDINLAYNCSMNAADIIRLIASFSITEINSSFSASDYYAAIIKGCKYVSSISLIRSDIIAKTTTESFRKINREAAAPNGADDLEHWIVEYKFNGEKYTGGMILICYGGNWRVQELATTVLNIPIYICAVPSSKIDYDSYAKQ